MGTRDDLLARLVTTVADISLPHPTRVAIDGPPATGKTTLADELAIVLRAHGREVIRAGIDDFLMPRAHRYRRGEYSGAGCYFDSHDLEALMRVLLAPLGPGGDRRFQPAVYDRARETPLPPTFTTSRADAILLFDGVFLMRPELNDLWDLRILLATEFNGTVDRAVIRDRGLMSSADIERRWRERYLPAQQLCSSRVDPSAHADFIVHNDDPQRPSWERRSR